jgi:hypothetical protein
MPTTFKERLITMGMDTGELSSGTEVIREATSNAIDAMSDPDTGENDIEMLAMTYNEGSEEDRRLINYVVLCLTGWQLTSIFKGAYYGG